MKRLLLLLVLFLPMFSMAQKKVAVYVTSSDAKVDDVTKHVVGNELVSVILNTTNYQAVERTEEFLGQISHEQGYQRSGNVDDNQISSIGKQFGVDYVCVAYILSYQNSFYVEARLIDVETANVINSAREISKKGTLDDVIAAASKLAQSLFNVDEKKSKPKAPQDTSSKKSLNFIAITANYSFMKIEDNPLIEERDFDKEIMNGFNVGLMAQANLVKGFVLVTGLQYQFTTYSATVDDDGSFRDEVSFTNHNIKIPLKLGYSAVFAKKGAFSIFAGPSFDFNVSTQLSSKQYYDGNLEVDYSIDFVNGKYKYYERGEGSSEEKSSDFKMLKLFDVPIGLGALLSYGPVGIRVEYEWGMIDRMKSGAPFKPSQLTVGLYYKFTIK